MRQLPPYFKRHGHPGGWPDYTWEFWLNMGDRAYDRYEWSFAQFREIYR